MSLGGGVRKEACPVSRTFIDYNAVVLNSSQMSQIIVSNWVKVRIYHT